MTEDERKKWESCQLWMDDITVGHYIEPDDDEFRRLRDEFFTSERLLRAYINKRAWEK